jgi:putative hydrolase of HD superfamily
MDDRISQILSFLERIDEFKTIERHTHIRGGQRKETDSDHTWHMALFALLFHRELEVEVDLAHVLSLILIHDLPELESGDTFAYSPHYGDKSEERVAAANLFRDLPHDLRKTLHNLWTEFTYGTSPEARFSRALDRLQALAQNTLSQGKTWKDLRVTEEMSRNLNRQVMGFDPALREAFEQLYDRASLEDLWGENGEARGSDRDR